VILLVYAVLFVIGALILFAPEAMLLMVWPVLFLYPQRLFYGLLPWNAGLDDLFILAVGVRILLFTRKAYPHKATAVVWLALMMAAMQLFAEITGVFRYPVLLATVARNGLKGIVFIVFAATLAKSIRTEDDIHRHLKMYLFAVSLAFLVVLLCYLKPSLGTYWEYYDPEKVRAKAELAGTALKRGFGPFSGPGSLGLIVIVSTFLALGLLWHKCRSRLLTFLAVLTLVTGAIAQIIGKSRAGIIGLAGAFATMALLSGKRKGVIALLILAIFAGALTGTWIGGFLEAAQARFSPERFSTDLATRAHGWKLIVTNPSPAILLFAEGGDAMGVRLGVAPHNGYIDVLFQWGLGGVICFAIVVGCVLKWSRFVLRTDDFIPGKATAWGVLWGSLGVALLALASDPWYMTNYRFSLYFLLVIVNVRYGALRYWAVEDSLLPEDAMLVPEYEGMPGYS